MTKIKKVLIFGGTHGNEMSGIFLVNKWLKNDQEIKERVHTCPVEFLISNPEAVSLCKRYKDCDLNRQFSKENYARAKNGVKPLPYEVSRAFELSSMFSAFSENPEELLVLDLHNTTSKMGCTLIIENINNLFNNQLAAFIQHRLREENCFCEVLAFSKSISSYPSTKSLSKSGIGLEVGPQPQGVLRADICQLQQRAVFHALDFTEKFNKGFQFPSCTLEYYEIFQKVGFPKTYSPSTVMIHEKIQDHDFEPLSLTDPIFRTVDDKELYLNDVLDEEVKPNEIVFPVFINEAAYYEKDLAFWLTIKKMETLTALVSK